MSLPLAAGGVRYLGPKGKVGRLGNGWLAEPAGLPPAGAARARELAALADRLAGAGPVRADLVVGGRSVWVEGAPLDEVVAALEVAGGGEPRRAPRHHELQVVYDGPDLALVAEWGGIEVVDVVRLHSEREYLVWVAGFLPGFAYLGEVEPQIARPRHATPRRRVPPGSVGIAGPLTGVYPSASPGGWNLVGRAPDARLFDPTRDPPRRLAVLDTVRFVPRGAGRRPDPARTEGREGGAAAGRAPALVVERAGPLVTVQDGGRPGQRAAGVPLGGALIPSLLGRANAAVGNAPGAAALGLFESELVAVVERDVMVSVDGEPARRARRGDRLHVPRGRAAVRYVAIAGALPVPVVLGARGTVPAASLGGVEGRPLRAGDRVPLELGPNTGAADGASPSGAGDAAAAGAPPWSARAAPGDGSPDEPLLVEVQLTLPDERLPIGAIEALLGAEYVVTPARDRTGTRLAGPAVPRAAGDRALPDPVVPGAIQVPGDGQPIVLGPDCAVTGGYPVAGVLTQESQEALAAARVGRRVRVRPALICSVR